MTPRLPGAVGVDSGPAPPAARDQWGRAAGSEVNQADKRTRRLPYRGKPRGARIGAKPLCAQRARTCGALAARALADAHAACPAHPQLICLQYICKPRACHPLQSTITPACVHTPPEPFAYREDAPASCRCVRRQCLPNCLDAKPRLASHRAEPMRSMCRQAHTGP